MRSAAFCSAPADWTKRLPGSMKIAAAKDVEIPTDWTYLALAHARKREAGRRFPKNARTQP